MNRQFILLLFICFLCSNVINYAQKKKLNSSPAIKPHISQIEKIQHNEIEQAFLYELVVIGSVIKIKETPASVNEMFHSEIIIKIDSILKGKTNFKNIIIRLQSGPVTDDKHGGDRIISSIEPKFKIGEQSVYFLHPAMKDSYLNSPFVKGRYQRFNGKKSITELSDSTFWVGDNQTFKIKDGMVYYFGKQKNKNKFIQNIIKRK